MTEKRLKALQWLFDVHHLGMSGDEADAAGGIAPSRRMHDLLARDWLIDANGRLTKLGLRSFNEAL